MSFSSLEIAPSIVKIISQQGFEGPYPIQLQAIPIVLQGKDLLGIAKTGSGKTASFVWPILTQLQQFDRSKSRHIQVLVLVPTRELADQVKEVFRFYSEGLPLAVKTLAVYGGVSINPQMMALQGVQVLIATPGRLLELEQKNALNLSETRIVVIDEADKMLNLGFKNEMDRVNSFLPRHRQNLLFSATLSKEIENLNAAWLHKPQVVQIVTEEAEADLIQQEVYLVSEERKGPLLRYLIKQNQWQQVLVFTSTLFRADSVADKLNKNGIDAEAIHSKKSQGARTEILHRFKTGKLQVLVATELLSRGIDIEFLPVVVNYELPRSPKDFIHRIGRTGRAEKPGKAVSLITPDEQAHFIVIQKKMGKWVERIDSSTINLQGF